MTEPKVLMFALFISWAGTAISLSRVALCFSIVASAVTIWVGLDTLWRRRKK